VIGVNRCCLCGFVTRSCPAQPPSPLSIETEREKEVCQQLKQANDTAARLRDELRQTAQLQEQLDKMTLETIYHDSKITDLSMQYKSA